MCKKVWALALLSLLVLACNDAPPETSATAGFEAETDLALYPVEKSNETLTSWSPAEAETTPVAPPANTDACTSNADCEAWMGGGACWSPVCEAGICVATLLENGSSCEAGACVVGGSCLSGACIGTPKDCGDENVCTSDLCDPSNGDCHHFPIHGNCEDGDLCTKNDICVDGGCVTGKALTCDDGAPCNGIESCDADSGECVATEIPACGDGMIDGMCGETCDDGNDIAGDGCDASCEMEPVTCLTGAGCDDGNVCTVDSCAGEGLCEFLPAAGGLCDDGDACTTEDTCTETGCVGSAGVVCDDGIDCTADSCDSASGCEFDENDLACDDGEPCTLNRCDNTVGCYFDPGNDGVACDDGNPCSSNGSCDGGSCAPGAETICDDGDPCTLDICGGDGACTTTPLSGTLCEDGDSCTAGDKCQAGACTPGFFVPVAGCVDSHPICEVSGVAGDSVSCMLDLARNDVNAAAAVGLQFNLQFSRTDIRITDFFDEICFDGNGCYTLPVTGGEGAANALSTGHTLILAPSSVENWNAVSCDASTPCGDGSLCVEGLCEESGGFGSMLVMNFSDLFAPVTDAYVGSDGTVTGEANFMEIRFELVRDISSDDPEWIKVSAMSANDASSESMNVDVIDGMLVTSLP